MSHNHQYNSIKNIKLAFFLNLCFTLLELIGGLLTNSVAIMSDALHDLGDSVSLGLAWFLEKYSHKKRTALFSYGYKRFSLLGAFINAVILLSGSFYILASALPRLINPEATNASGMFLVSLIGIAINGLAVYKTSQGKTMNEKVINLHLLEDLLGWIAVFIVSIVMYFTDLNILDPILSIMITLYILNGVIRNLKETALIFLQTTPKEIHLDKINQELSKDVRVKTIHDTHTWSLDGESNIITTHVIIDKACSKTDIIDIKCQLKKILYGLGIEHSTLEIEFEDENCVECCN